MSAPSTMPETTSETASASIPDDPARADGRTTRWDTHRATRRAELTQAALRAIKHHGPGIGMEEIAAEAGTSRTVLYRHLGDRTGAWRAVVATVDARILGDLQRAAREEGASGDPRAVIAALVDSYLGLVERDPEIYRFVVTRPLTDTSPDDPVAGMSSRMGAQVTSVIAQLLFDAGVPQARARRLAGTWGHALVGAVRAVADEWMNDPHRRPRAELVAEIADLHTAAIHAETGR